MAKVLIVDNYDSFVYTLVGYLKELGADTRVIRNDDLTLEQAKDLVRAVDGVLVSPGPGNPAGAGICVDLIRHLGERDIPMFGVCLGHQALTEAFGGTVSHAEQLMHGKTSDVEHADAMVFQGLPSPFKATRYHSLASVKESVPEDLVVTAWTADGTIMGISHRTKPLHGVQFHPESVLTEGGYRILGNWLESIGQEGAARTAAGLSPLVR